MEPTIKKCQLLIKTCFTPLWSFDLFTSEFWTYNLASTFCCTLRVLFNMIKYFSSKYSYKSPLLLCWAECPPCRPQFSSLYRVEAGREYQWESSMNVPGVSDKPASNALRRIAHTCWADVLGILELSFILPRLLLGQMKEPVALEIKVKMLVSDRPKSPFPVINFRVCWFQNEYLCCLSIMSDNICKVFSRCRNSIRVHVVWFVTMPLFLLLLF